jgi:hypothetical protein
LWARAAKHAVAVVTGISVIVARRKTAHESLALHISRCALPTSTLQPISAAIAIVLVLVFGTVGCASGTGLLGIALADTGAADGAGGGKLAASAAVLVGIVADGIVLELACAGITALIVATALLATAVAFLVTFDNAVSTGLACDGSHVPVVAEARRLDTLASKSRADVANGAGGETSNSISGGGIHNKTFTSIALVGAERTALLSVDKIRVSALIGRTVMDGAVSVACFVSNNLPFGAGADDHVGSSDGLP